MDLDAAYSVKLLQKQEELKCLRVLRRHVHNCMGPLGQNKCQPHYYIAGKNMGREGETNVARDECTLDAWLKLGVKIQMLYSKLLKRHVLGR